MRKIIEAGLLIALAVPAAATAQSAIDGMWKLDVGALPFSTRTEVWILQDGRYQCKSCTPPIDVKANGSDQPTPGQQYDTISVRILDDHTIRLIEKKNGQIAIAMRSSRFPRMETRAQTNSRVGKRP